MTKSTSYTPGTDSIDITAPGGLEALFALHRSTFGDLRMEVDDGADGGDGGDGGGDGGDAATFTDPETGEKFGFPEKTPTSQMTPEQSAEYWRHKAQKHEKRAKAAADYDSIKAERDELKNRHQSDDEKALEQATTQAAENARAEERSHFAERLVLAEFKAANAGRIPADQFSAVLDGIAATRFLTDDGEVDTDKVQQYVEGIAPAATNKWPDTGQGRRQQQKSAGVGAGRELFTASRPGKS